VTGPAVPVTQGGPDPSMQRSAGQGIGRAAALIAALTILARLLGLVRTLVFSQTVGAGCLGTAYNTANLVPNIIYDIVLGGALTSIMVPVLARPAARAAADPQAADEVSQTSSALLTWTVLILVPASVVIAAVADPLASLLSPHNPGGGCALHQQSLVHVTGSMLAVFAPQIVFYGLAVVLYGILQAHRRFGAPALAPVISSLVVITAYAVFVPLGSGFKTSRDLAGLPLSAELVLSVGTTAGVAALVLTALVPAWRLHIRVRPTLRFPAGVGRRAGGLAVYGVAALLAQDLSSLVVVLLANGRGSAGALVLYSYGWQFFEAAYAVLAISIAVSAFPALSTRVGTAFDETAAGATRAVLLLSFGGTALLIAVAIPAAHFMQTYSPQVPQLASGFVLFALGLAGYGLVACLSRVLLAAGQTTATAVIVAGGWFLVIVADVVLVSVATASSVVAMLALGNSIGLTAAGAALLAAVRRSRGVAALRGTLRTIVSGLAAATAGAGAGTAVAVVLPTAGRAQAAGAAVLAVLVALVAFGLVAYVLDAGELRAAVASARAAAAGLGGRPPGTPREAPR
jgi:putative peptidoglycan lipid II flippase